MSGEQIEFLGAYIKQIRNKNKLTQSEFGARLGVSHAHISKIESGKEQASESLLKLIKYEFPDRNKNAVLEEDRNRVFLLCCTKVELILDFIKTHEDIPTDTLIILYIFFDALLSLLESSTNNYKFLTDILDYSHAMIDEPNRVLEMTSSTTLSKNEMKAKSIIAKNEILSCADALCEKLDCLVK